jgi:hypothetical protein
MGPKQRRINNRLMSYGPSHCGKQPFLFYRTTYTLAILHRLLFPIVFLAKSPFFSMHPASILSRLAHLGAPAAC